MWIDLWYSGKFAPSWLGRLGFYSTKQHEGFMSYCVLVEYHLVVSLWTLDPASSLVLSGSAAVEAKFSSNIDEWRYLFLW